MTAYRHPIYFAPRAGTPDSNAVHPVGAFDYAASQRVVLDAQGEGSAKLPVGCHMCRVRIVDAAGEVMYRADGSDVFTDADMPALVPGALPIDDVVVTDPERMIYFLGAQDDELVVTPYLTLYSTDDTAPSVPANLTAVAASATAIDLEWEASTDDGVIAGYRIYRDDVLVTQVHRTLLVYGDTGLTAETEYTYEVSAVDSAGNESERSTPAVETTDPA